MDRKKGAGAQIETQLLSLSKLISQQQAKIYTPPTHLEEGYNKDYSTRQGNLLDKGGHWRGSRETWILVPDMCNFGPCLCLAVVNHKMAIGTFTRLCKALWVESII